MHCQGVTHPPDGIQKWIQWQREVNIFPAFDFRCQLCLAIRIVGNEILVSPKIMIAPEYALCKLYNLNSNGGNRVSDDMLIKLNIERNYEWIDS